MSDADVRKLLATVDRVIIAKGKAAREVSSREASLDDLRGPTGKFRAPMIRRGKRLLVGFSEAELGKVLAK